MRETTRKSRPWRGLAAAREYLLLTESLRESEHATTSQRATAMRYLAAATPRIQAARHLREAGMCEGAVILFLEGVLLLARAHLAWTSPDLEVASIGPRETVETLDRVLAEALQPKPAAWTRSAPLLTDPANGEIDRMAQGELAMRAEDLDGTARWLADLSLPRLPRQVKATRNFRLTMVALSIAALAVGREIWIRNPRNLALHKTATSSSVASGAPSGAVDDTRYGLPGFVSQDEKDPWLTVDLGQRYFVTDAEVWARHDCCFDQALPLDFELSDDGTSFRTMDTRTTAFVSLEPWIIGHVGVAGRYVRVRKRGSGVLALTEVVVFGRGLR
jgi:hypothetical protein